SGDDAAGQLQVDLAVAVGCVQHALDLVPGRQGQVHQVGADRQLAVSHQVEDGLHLVGETGDVVEAEHGAGTLDGVHGAEDPADQVDVLRPLFQFQKGALQLAQ